MSWNRGNTPDRQTAGDLMISVFEDFKRTFEEVQYGRILYNEIIPEESVRTDVNPGATELSYGIRDWKGKGEFNALQDQDIPSVQMTFDKSRIPIQAASVSGKFSNEDARRIQFGHDMSSLEEFPRIMRMACDRHVEGTVFFGQPLLNFQGYLAYDGVAANTVALNEAGTSTFWVDKVPDEIQFDVNNAIATTWVNSRQVHLPNYVYLPVEQYAYISSQRMSDAADKSVLDYLKTNNIYTSVNDGKELNIKPLRYLQGAGAAGTDRFIVVENNADNFVWPWPIPFDLLDPQFIGLDVKLIAEYKFGSFHAKYPGCMSYNDGI